MLSRKIKALRDEAYQLRADAGDNITEEQLTQIEALLDEADELQAKADRLAKIDAAAPAPSASKSSVKTGLIEVGASSVEKDPMAGFKTSQEFFSAIAKNRGRAGSDERLRYLAAVGSDEHNTQDGQYGGFGVPEAMLTEVKKVTPEMNPLAERVTSVPMEAPSVKLNARVDKDHSSSVAGGLQVYRRGEEGAATSSRQSMEQIVLSANSLTGLTYATRELIYSSPATVASILADFPQAFADKEFEEMLNGSGVDEFEGIANCPATISVAKEGGQAADTIVKENILKMRARCWGFQNAVWIANHDAYPQLAVVGGDGNGSGNLYQNSISEDRPDTLLGRPIFYSEYTETLGDKGDIYLLDMSQYLMGEYKAMESMSSVHVRFVENEEAFRFDKSNDARSWWRSALTPRKGASTLSPFVTLAARA